MKLWSFYYLDYFFMKLCKYCLDVGFVPARKCGAGVAIGAAVAAIGSIAAASIASDGQEAINNKNIAFASQTNQETREWNEKMYGRQVNDAIAAESRANAEYRNRQALQLQQSKELTDYLYKNFNSPEAMSKALRSAGLNPSVLYGSGMSGFQTSQGSVSSPSAPSIGSAPVVGSPSMLQPNLQNEMAAYANLMNSMGESFSSMMSGRKTGVETNQLERSFDIAYQSMLEDLQLKKTANARQTFLLALDKSNLPKRQKQEIRLLEIQADNALLDGDLIKAKEIFTKAETRLTDITAKYKDTELSQLPTLLRLQVKNAEAEISLTKAMEKTEGTKQSLNSSQSKLADQQTETEKYNSRIKSIEAETSEKAKLDKLNALLSDLHRQASENKQKKLAADIQRFRDSLNDPRNKDSGRQKVDVGLDWIRQKFGFGVSSTISFNK